jgi:hypothetical protein
MPRRYGFEEARFAALALELARWKLPVGPLRWILSTLHANVAGDRPNKRDSALWRRAIDAAGPVYFCVQATGSVDEMNFAISLQIDGATLYRLLRPTESYASIGSVLVVDLSGIFRRLSK